MFSTVCTHNLVRCLPDRHTHTLIVRPIVIVYKYLIAYYRFRFGWLGSPNGRRTDGWMTITEPDVWCTAARCVGTVGKGHFYAYFYAPQLHANVHRVRCLACVPTCSVHCVRRQGIGDCREIRVGRSVASETEGGGDSE